MNQYGKVPYQAVKENTGNLMLTDDQKNYLWWTKAVLAFLTFVSAGVSLALVLAVPATWTIFMISASFVRNSSANTGSTTPILYSDGYPGFGVIPTTTAADFSEITPTVNVGLVAVFVSILAFVGYLVGLLVHKSEMEQMNRGANPYFFLFSTFWTPIAFLVWGFLAGIPNLFVLTFIGLATWAWLWLFWADDLLNSYAYRATMAVASSVYETSGQSDTSMWKWVTYVQGLIFAIATYVIIFVYAGYTWGAPGGDDPDTGTPPGALLWNIIIGMVLYLGIPVILLLYCQQWLIKSLYAREMTLYIYSFVVVLVATWLTLILFAVSNPIVPTP